MSKYHLQNTFMSTFLLSYFPTFFALKCFASSKKCCIFADDNSNYLI